MDGEQSLAVAVADAERIDAGPVFLRPVVEDDCTPRYLAWLRDAQVNRYLETRFQEQTPESVLAFVRAVRADPSSHLLAICDVADGSHVGNIKLGPIRVRHRYADVSFFIGEVDRWGRGFASAAIAAATRLAFDRFGLHRCQAGAYATNRGSIRALEKAGYRREGVERMKLRGENGWEDRVCFGALREEWGVTTS